eukprot:scaffold3941_cov412-Prasinococcus_capsulatus_cf.AAC.17
MHQASGVWTPSTQLMLQFSAQTSLVSRHVVELWPLVLMPTAIKNLSANDHALGEANPAAEFS